MMKKNRMEKMIKAMAISAAMVMVCGTMTGCGNSDAAKAVQAAGSQNIRTEARVSGLYESDLKGLVEGLEDHYVLENAKGVDYLYGVKYDKEKGIVKSVEVDSAKVDLSKPDKYEVIYTVTVDEQFVSKQAKSADAVKSADAEETADAEKSVDAKKVADTDTEVEVKKEIEVVDEEKAKELAAKGEEVWTDNNEVLPKAEESADAETANAGEESAQMQASSEENKAEGTKAQASHKEAGAASAANNTPSAKPQAQSAHTHTWVTVEATGHYEEQVVQAAWDEPVYDWAYCCNQCSYYTTSDRDIVTHSCQYGHNYRSDEVQISTTHHPAVTKSVWVQDSAAYQRCSGCGATK